MKQFNSKQSLDDIFKILEANDGTPSDVVRVFTEVENKLTEIYQQGFKDGAKIDKDLYNIIKPEE